MGNWAPGPDTSPRRAREDPPPPREEQIWGRSSLVPGPSRYQLRAWTRQHSAAPVLWGLQEGTRVGTLCKRPSAVRVPPSGQAAAAGGGGLWLSLSRGSISCPPQTFHFVPTLRFSFPSQTSSCHPTARGVTRLNQLQTPPFLQRASRYSERQRRCFPYEAAGSPG